VNVRDEISNRTQSISDSINERVNAHAVDTRKKTKLIPSEVEA